MINFLKISTITIFIFFSCENNPAFYTDCNGETNGLAIEDNCGNCDNNPTNDCTLDCNNIWGGNSVFDECGVCGGNGKLNCNGECIIPDMNGNYIDDYIDCSGTCNGNATLDECNVCNGLGAVYLCGCSGLEQGKCDCDGNILDCNDVCGGTSELDCNGECGGLSLVDECGVCGGDGTEENFNCNGECIAEGSSLDSSGYDECGVCGGDNSTCSSEFDGCDLPINHIYSLNGAVYYNVDFNITGFQWVVEGATVSNASGGDAASFIIQTSPTFVIGYSFGGIVSAGCGILTNLELSQEPIQFTDIIFEDDSNNPFFNPTVYYWDN